MRSLHPDFAGDQRVVHQVATDQVGAVGQPFGNRAEPQQQQRGVPTPLQASDHHIRRLQHPRAGHAVDIERRRSRGPAVSVSIRSTRAIGAQSTPARAPAARRDSDIFAIAPRRAAATHCRSRCRPGGRRSPRRRRPPASATSASRAGRSRAPTDALPARIGSGGGTDRRAAAASPGRQPSRRRRPCDRSRRRRAPDPRRRSASPAPARARCPFGNPTAGSAARAR